MTAPGGNPSTAIERTVARLRRRWLAVHLAQGALRAFFYGLLFGAVLLLVRPAVGLGGALAVAAGVGLFGGLALALRRVPSAAALAKAFDDQAGLSDRVSSAVELGAPTSGMVAALLEESAAAAAQVEPRRVFPYAMPREGWLLPLPVLLVAAVLLLPGLLSAEPEPDPAVEEVIGQSLEELEDMLSRERQKEPTPKRKEYIAELEKLKSELERDKLDKKDAMAEVAKLLEKIQEERDRELKKKEELEKLLESLRKGDDTNKLAEPLDKGDYEDALNKLEELLDELQKKLDEMKKNGASPEELKKLEQKIQELKQLRAKLVNLLQIDVDLSMMGEMIDFLEDFEGDLGDISDLDLEFVKPDCKCDKPGL